MTQDPNTPKYDHTTGLLTDYGRSLGLKEVNSPANGGGSSSNSNSTGDAFLSAIQDKLMAQSGVVSSTNSQLENRINSAISGVQSATDKSNLATESAYNRERAFQEGQNSLSIQNSLENRSGFATQMVAFRNLVQTTDKNLNDLEQRKNELILQNDASGASKIADLQLQALQFQQTAQQNTFSNLLGMANFGLQSKQNELAQNAQTFAQTNAISQIALKYGLTVQPGDTIQSITTRAMPYASKEEAAQLAKLNSETNLNNAQAAKYAQEGVANKNFDSSQLDSMAMAFNANPAVLNGTDLSVANISKVVTRAAEIKNQGIIGAGIANGTSKEDLKKKILTDTTLSPAQKTSAIDYLEKNFQTVVSQVGAKIDNSGKIYGAPSLASDIVGTGVNIARSSLDFLTGNRSGSRYDYATGRLVPNQ